MRCTHCGNDNFVKNGSYKGVQRYKCKNCFLYFSDKARKFNYGLLIHGGEVKLLHMSCVDVK